MTFKIIEVSELGSCICQARIRHGDVCFTAIVAEPLKKVETLLDDFAAEIDFQSLIRCETELVKENSSSGIFSTDDPNVVIADGTVLQIVPLEDGETLIDVYIQKGPEFVTVSSEELGATPEVGSRVRLWLRGLRLFPSFT